MAKAPFRSQINLITNNFKIKSKKEKGVIYTYKVEFIESGSEETKEQESLESGLQKLSLEKAPS